MKTSIVRILALSNNVLMFSTSYRHYSVTNQVLFEMSFIISLSFSNPSCDKMSKSPSFARKDGGRTRDVSGRGMDRGLRMYVSLSTQ